ncbi:ABC transporter ATP-binding protein [Methylomonas sp. ZR1]|uniref:ABC transporter ATP-binding protein n=1 Tax=Methylomonas sp. ZR1 TaxID=1797072 RepID=UPI0014915789|nr:ABC transporter ATP-binding protein [Methylomonas sp. ZR1]NOV28833.1 ABC transporter ATP-binding protein [Methylomonas sp. ZR1]
MAIIEVNHLTKEYQLGHLTSLKETALNTMRRLAFQPVQERESFKALDDVNFHINEGEVVGIIGHNGAGKSTLLKHLANISKPTKGEVIVKGSVAPLIEVGAGVNPELTGRENIYLNGAILGIPKKIIQQKLDEIIDFSELEQFIDTPVKRYSSGMTVKLGFSIATSMEADILIIDEVLAVGDLAFQRKCFDRMEDLIRRQGKTVLLVSHNIRQIERLCNRVILLSKGSVIGDGDANSLCAKFYQANDKKISIDSSTTLSLANNNEWATGEIHLVDIKLLNSSGNSITELKHTQAVTIKLVYEVKNQVRYPMFGVGIHTTDFIYLATQQSINQLKIEKLDIGIYEFNFEIESFPFMPGVYSIRAGVAEGSASRTIFYAENLLHFQVTSENLADKTWNEGLVSLPGTWTFTAA